MCSIVHGNCSNSSNKQTDNATMKMTILSRKLIALSVAFVLSVFVLNTQEVSAQKSDKEVAEAYNKALATAKAKDYTQAIVDFNAAKKVANAKGDKAIAGKADKYLCKLYYNTGSRKLKKDDVAGAESDFKAGMAICGNYHKHHQGMAIVEKQRGNVEASMEAYSQCAELANKAGKLKDWKSCRSQTEGFAANAMKDENYTEVIRLANLQLKYSDTSKAHYYLAYSHNQLGDSAAALASCEKALELESGSKSKKAPIEFEKGTALKNLNRFEEAKVAFANAAFGEFAARAKHEVDALGGSN